jgi:hypothetical protein
MISSSAEKMTSNSEVAFIGGMDYLDHTAQARARPAEIIEPDYFIPQLTQYMTAVWGS